MHAINMLLHATDDLRALGFKLCGVAFVRLLLALNQNVSIRISKMPRKPEH